MCDRHLTQGDATSPTHGSRRRRLWNLPEKAHCPVVGVCLQITTLRKIATKVVGAPLQHDDYDVHVWAVAQCSSRNALSESLQKQLEQRYACQIRAFSTQKSAEGVWELWVQAVERGDVAGALWAGLTHPQCDEALEEGLIRDMHMLQHQAGAHVRVDLRKHEQLQQDNRKLIAELNALRERHAAQLEEKLEQNRTLQRSLVRARGDLIARQTLIDGLTQQLASLENQLPELENALRQGDRLQQLTERKREAEVRIDTLEQELARANQQNALLQVKLALALETSDTPAGAVRPAPVNLREQTVLCVGGRMGNVAAYRQAIEKTGAQFCYHDGGIEHSAHHLEASLTAADMVICQTGCVSHNAYWRVKDYCKRHGKRCVFVDNPSVASFTRSLEEVFQLEGGSAND